MKNIALFLTLFFGCLQIIYAQHPGDPDHSFGKNGVVTTDIGNPLNHYGSGNQVLVRSDGSIYIILAVDGGTIITKKNPDGSADLSYGHSGFSVKVQISDGHAAVQPDGRIVIAGREDIYYTNTELPTSDFSLARINTDGSLDNSFGSNGHVTTDFSIHDDAVKSLVIGNSGQAVAVGFSVSAADNLPDGDSYISLARYDINGNLITQLLSNIVVRSDDSSISAAIQPDGKIIVGCTNEQGLKLARYNVDGALDTTFKFTNSLRINANSYFVLRSLAIDSNGKIVVGGYWQNSTKDFAVARFNNTGKLDSTFSTDGIKTTDFRNHDDVITSLAFQTDHKILAGGFASNGTNYGFAIARYKENGNLDSTFDVDGIKLTYIGPIDIFAASLATEPTGKILLAGHNNSILPVLKMAVYNSDGSLDNSFAKKGTLTDSLKQQKTIYTGTAVQPDGKIVTAGYAWNGANYDFAVARYLTDGRLDNSFSSDGKQTTDQGSDEYGRAVAIQADGKIVVAGTGIVRYNIDGSLDNTFNSTGKQQTGFEALFVKVQGDGKIVVAGSQAISRYNSNGTIDNSFNGTGSINTTFIKDIALQNDGKIIFINDQFQITRYNTNGSFNGSTVNGTFQTLNFLPDNEDDEPVQVSTSIGIQKDGKIVVGGYAGFNGRYDDDYNVVVGRLNTNGQLDSTFSGTGKTTIQFNQLSLDGTIAIESDNKIVVKGIVYYNADRYYYRQITPTGYAFARLNPDGGIDYNFGSGGIIYPQINDSINAIAIGNNKLYVGGFGRNLSEFGFLSSYLLTENQSPSVKITSPANDTSFTTPATIKITANASDSDGTISYVSFYNNGALLQTDSTSPYNYIFTNAVPGNYNVVAKAAAANGLITNSASVTFSVADDTNKAPLVSIKTPVNNATYPAGASITINATASDPDGTITTVKFYNGSTLLKTDSTSPYNYTLTNAPAGNYKLFAKATDNKGLSNSSATVTVFAGSGSANKAPSIILSGPVNNATYTAPANITLNATATEQDGAITSVQFYNGSTLLATDSTSPYTYTLNNAAAGNYSFVAKAIDNSGLINNSATVAVTVSAPVNKAPVVTLTSPAGNTVSYSGGTIILKAVASDADGSISNVKFYTGNTLLKTVSSAPYNDTINNVAAGSYSFVAKATDNKGLTASSGSVYVSVRNNIAPGVYVYPTYNIYTVPASIQLTAGASDPDGTISYVEFYYGTTLIVRDSTYPYVYNWLNVPAGDYALTARATDNHGATTISDVYDLNFTPYPTFEAEDAQNNGPVFSNVETGFSGYGYEQYTRNTGDNTQWTVKASVAGSFLLQFRYSNATSNRPLQLKVNGVVVIAKLDFISTGAWSTWSVSSATANLTAGVNYITLTSIGYNGPYLDNLSVTYNNSLEAEDAVLSGPLIASKHPGFTGKGYADYTNATGDYIEWTPDAPAAGAYSLHFRYANGSTNRPLQLMVNGVVVNASLNFASTGGWSTWSTSSATANLIAGANKIRLTTIVPNGPNVDNLTFDNADSIQGMQSFMNDKTILFNKSTEILKAVVSPNPVAGNAKLIVTTSSVLPINLSLVDISGKTYRSAKFFNKGSNAYDFSVNGLPAGSYIIILKQGNLTTNARLIVGKK